jgi:microcystin degradation protein MlrC
VRNAGLSAVIVTDGDKALATRLRDELLGEAWYHREDFVFKIEKLPQSVARAKAWATRRARGPIILLDHYDNCASGGTMDTTVVLAGVLRQDLSDIVAFAIFDPAAVQEAISAGVGADVTLSIGGKTQMPAIAAASPPLRVSGRVRTMPMAGSGIAGPWGAVLRRTWARRSSWIQGAPTSC